MNTHRLRRIVKHQPGRRLKHHICDRIGRVVAVFIDAAERHQHTAGVTARCTSAHFVHLRAFQIEQVKQLLRPLGRYCPVCDISFIVFSEILVDPPETDPVLLPVQAHPDMINEDKLDCILICPGRFRGDMIKTFRHLKQFCLSFCVFFCFRHERALFAVAFRQDHHAFHYDRDRAVKAVFLYIIAEHTAFQRCHVFSCFFIKRPEAPVDKLLIIRAEMAHRGSAYICHFKCRHTVSRRGRIPFRDVFHQLCAVILFFPEIHDA